jgi:hypothetical protein
MDKPARDYFPPGDLRVSDAERDLALSELSTAVAAGRITADEYNERTIQILAARTGKELAVPLADLPLEQARATSVQRPQRTPIFRFTFGASVAAGCFTAVAIGNALTSIGPTAAQRAAAQAVAARMGIPAPDFPVQSFNWAGTLIPAGIAVLIVVLIIYLRVTRAEGREAPPA